jgi:cyclopropane-fatty-acyl-phospholipid synthase
MATTTKYSFYEKVVLNLLSKMQLGKLNLTMPSGELINIGNGEGKVIANVKVNHSECFIW